MDNRWIQGKIEEYSFLKLAQFILPKTEFPVRTYPCLELLRKNEMEEAREKAIPRFHYVTKEEETAIFDGSWNADTNYESEIMPYGFYFVDVALGELRRLFRAWFCDEQIDKMIRPYYEETNGTVLFSKQLLTTAVFIILHEYGHYLDYKRIGSKIDTAKWIYESKKPFREYEKTILEKKENHTLTKEYYNHRMEVYRQCSDERSADEYALSCLKDKVEEAFNHICG